MRFLRFAFLAATALSAQPVISNVQVKTSHGSVRVQADIANAVDQSLLQLHYGTTAALGYNTANAAIGGGTARYLMEGGLAPQTTYFFRIKVTASTGTTWLSCSPGSSGPGWTCDDASGIPTFTTAALPPNHGEPEQPTQLNTSMPQVNGQTFNVAADCSNLQPMLNACAAADTSLVHRVMIPPGAVCTANYLLPAKIGPGTCIVRSAASDSLLTPEGVQISDDYASLMPLFKHTVAHSQIPQLSVVANAQGWRLMGLRFAPEKPLDTYKKIAVADVGSDGVVTTVAPHGLTNNHTISIYGVTGFNGRGPNGTWYVYSAMNATQFKLGESVYGKAGSLVLSCASPPCYKGGGYVLLRIGNAISDVSGATPPVVTTPLEHGLINEPWSTISSASGATLTLANGHFIDGHITPVEVAGSSVAAYNGIWNRNGVNGNNLTLTGGPTGSCSANCGQVRIKRVLHIKGVEGATAVNGNHFFTVVDNNHIQIDDAAAGGTYASGGILSQDPDIYNLDISVDPGASRIVIDRSIFKGASEWPQRKYASISLSSDRSAIVDSRIEAIKMWNAINPKTGSWEYSVFGDREAYAIFISLGNVQKVHNTFIECQGICVFAEESPVPTKSDFTFTRNYMYNSPVDMAGGPQSNGLYYRRRQHFELKQGKRFLIDGNMFDGGWIDGTPCGAPLLFTPRASVHPSQQNVVSDITITNNTIRNSPGGIQLLSADLPNYPTGYLTSRIKIHNNLLFDIDRRKFYSNPNLTGGGICGYFVKTYGSFEDIQISHNSVLDVRGTLPQFFGYEGGRSEGVVVRYNLYTHNHERSEGALQAAGTVGDIGPTPTGTIKQVWDSMFPVNSVFSHNVVIPGVRNTASDSSYESSNRSITFAQPDCAAYYTGFAGVSCLGSPSGNDTANQRLGITGFYDSGHRNLTLRFNSPAKAAVSMDGLDAGVDMNALESAQGKVRNVRLEAGTNSATLSYIAPDEAACFIDYVTDPAAAIPARISDAGGNTLRTITLPNLTRGTLYHYRLQCASQQPKGTFVTQE